MNFRISLFIILIFDVAGFSSCKKEPGIGGDATINGHIHVQHFNSTFTQFISEYDGADVYVYLVAGIDQTYLKRIKSDYNGDFEFKYLYKGDYTVYCYSIDSTFSNHQSTSSGMIPVIQQISVVGRKDVITTDTLKIFN